MVVPSMVHLSLIDVRDGGLPAVEAALECPNAALSELAAVAAACVRVSSALLAYAELAQRAAVDAATRTRDAGARCRGGRTGADRSSAVSRPATAIS